MEAHLINLNTNQDALTKFAIKAFSDTIQLANIEVAGLTQDIQNNAGDIAMIGQETVLWESLTGQNAGTIILSDNYSNYKYLVFKALENGGNQDYHSSILVNNVPINRLSRLLNTEEYIFSGTFSDEKILDIYAMNGMGLLKITGIK